MHIAILASTPNIAKKIRADLGDTADCYTTAVSWPDLVTSLQKERTDLRSPPPPRSLLAVGGCGSPGRL
jgi:hypothetical protein